jgi:hypothetical protein
LSGGDHSNWLARAHYDARRESTCRARRILAHKQHWTRGCLPYMAIADIVLTPATRRDLWVTLPVNMEGPFYLACPTLVFPTQPNHRPRIGLMRQLLSCCYRPLLTTALAPHCSYPRAGGGIANEARRGSTYPICHGRSATTVNAHRRGCSRSPTTAQPSSYYRQAS